MAGVDTRPGSSRRAQVGLLVLLCAFLMSGASGVSTSAVGEAPWDSAVLHTGAVDAYPADARWIADVLASVNPSLSPRERLRIGAAIERYSRAYSLEPDLVLAVMLVESNARPWARSPKGAVGLMQVMPHMMEPLGLAGNLATIESNIEAGCVILSGNIRRLGLEDGISAYFWGSDIRGVAYLEKVLAARDRVRSLETS